MLEREEWKDVVGYEGHYQVSNLGRVKSLDRLVSYKNGRSQFYESKLLKQQFVTGRYLKVALCKNGNEETALVHRLVAQAFIENLSGYKEINHKDFNRSNNILSNLEWCNHQDNITYSIERMARGTSHHSCKLSEKDVLEIRKKYIPKIYSSRKITKEYGIVKSTVLNIVNRKIWNHI